MVMPASSSCCLGALSALTILASLVAWRYEVLIAPKLIWMTLCCSRYTSGHLQKQNLVAYGLRPHIGTCRQLDPQPPEVLPLQVHRSPVPPHSHKPHTRHTLSETLHLDDRVVSQADFCDPVQRSCPAERHGFWEKPCSSHSKHINTFSNSSHRDREKSNSASPVKIKRGVLYSKEEVQTRSCSKEPSCQCTFAHL